MEFEIVVTKTAETDFDEAISYEDELTVPYLTMAAQISF